MAIFQTRRRLVGRNRSRARALLLSTTTMLATALALGATAFAGPLRGSVSLPRDAQPQKRAEGSPDHYWRVWNGVLEPRPDAFDPTRELAVVLTGPVSGDPIGCAYALRGGNLLPTTLAVRAKTTLRIENSDGCSHSLFADGIAEFAAAETPPGNARVVSVGEGGPWVIRDASHGHVEGHLHAIPDLVACGSVDPRGGFTFPSVPAGEYTVKVFRGPHEVGRQAVTITDARELTIAPLPINFPGTR